jgi:hypothetical protein
MWWDLMEKGFPCKCKFLKYKTKRVVNYGEKCTCSHQTQNLCADMDCGKCGKQGSGKPKCKFLKVVEIFKKKDKYFCLRSGEY